MAASKVSTNAIKTAWIARKRADARSAGLCITCCKQRPDKGYAVCRQCKKAAHDRRVRRRATLRERAEFQHVIEAHERGGDVAREHHLYEDAVQRYQRALSVHIISSDDRLRISGKLSYVLHLSGNPATANPWGDQALSYYLRNPAQGAKEVESLIQQKARQLWTNLKTEETLPILMRAIYIAEAIGNESLRKMSNVWMAISLNLLTRFNEAKKFLNAIGELTEQDRSDMHALYHMAKGSIAGAFGNAEDAYANFERAAAIAEDIRDFHLLTIILGNYSVWGTALGDVERGKLGFERALLIARINQLGWRIPYLCLKYADILEKMGHYEIARSYIIDALSYDAQAPLIEFTCAKVAIPIALHTNDELLLEKFARTSVLERAFRSNMPENIAEIASAFAQFYAERGNARKAQEILHRAITVLPQLDDSWDLPLEVARHGSLSDVPRARSLLENRVILPHSAVAQASLSLFDAYIAQRRKYVHLMRRYAIEASDRFDRLGLYRYSEAARALMPARDGVQRATVPVHRPFDSIQPALTFREQQVAELVLKGCMNREIALMLSVSEKTVEKYVAVIMSQFGIRSRHQLADVFTRPSG